MALPSEHYYILEGIAGIYYYHLSRTPKGPALCGETRLMFTQLPLKTWGMRGHLNEKYCQRCEEAGHIKVQK